MSLISVNVPGLGLLSVGKDIGKEICHVYNVFDSLFLWTFLRWIFYLDIEML